MHNKHTSIHAGVHVTMESLIKDKELIGIIKDLVCGSGRLHSENEMQQQQLIHQVSNANGVGTNFNADPLAVR